MYKSYSVLLSNSTCSEVCVDFPFPVVFSVHCVDRIMLVIMCHLLVNMPCPRLPMHVYIENVHRTGLQEVCTRCLGAVMLTSSTSSLAFSGYGCGMYIHCH